MAPKFALFTQGSKLALNQGFKYMFELLQSCAQPSNYPNETLRVDGMNLNENFAHVRKHIIRKNEENFGINQIRQLFITKDSHI